jgi:soluble lytic murein transglycosylase
MPEGEHKVEQWLYWQARAMEAQGQDAAARRLYRLAAGERSLWGFLAAERVGTPYKLASRPTPAAEERLTRIEQSRGGRRISELLALARPLDARREIQALVRGMEPEDLMAAAVLIRRWGWPDQAIFTLARSGYWDDLELRFPIHHQELVRRQAGETGLDESWIFAVLRQESAFNPQVVSHAGALGLMQLLPATAREVARSLGEPPPNRWRLLDPEVNIRLGSAYLARMQTRFDDHPVLAAAAYNAGPHRVERWLPSHRTAADIWVATIPFRETRRYVRRVLAYRLIYDHRLGREIRPLSALLRPVGGTDPEFGAVASGEGI